MIVFDLKCHNQGHVFEAWFGSSSAYEDQRNRKLIACPICGDSDVTKALMAPNIGAKGNKGALMPVAKPDASPPADPQVAEAKALIEKLAKLQSKMLEKSQWVGRSFDSQARAMDAGEVPHQSIHGEVTPQEAKALIEDGIGVLPLPLPYIPPDKRN